LLLDGTNRHDRALSIVFVGPTVSVAFDISVGGCVVGTGSLPAKPRRPALSRCVLPPQREATLARWNARASALWPLRNAPAVAVAGEAHWFMDEGLRGRGCRGHRLPGGHRQIAARPGAGSAQAETYGLRVVGASVRTTHVAEGAAVNNQSAEVSHSPRRIENKSPPATGSTQGAYLVDRTISTLATTAP
jgi:hypothetical protein